MNYVSCDQLENYFKSNSDSDYVVVMNQTEFDNHPDSFYEKDLDTGETIPMVFVHLEDGVGGNTWEVFIEGDDYDLR